MSSNTPNLSLPLVQEAQSNKHVTVNTDLTYLDSAVQLSVIFLYQTTPPVSPNDGDRYVPAYNANGAWSGQGGKIAYYNVNAWIFFTPKPGWFLWSQSSNALYYYSNSSWNLFSPPAVPSTTAPYFGINNVANTLRRLNVSSRVVEFAYDPTYVNDSVSMEVVYNKKLSTSNASTIYRTDGVEHASCGLIGSDNYTIRTTPNNGTTQNNALVIDLDGVVYTPQIPYISAFTSGNKAWGVVIDFNTQAISTSYMTISPGKDRFTFLKAGLYTLSLTITTRGIAHSFYIAKNLIPTDFGKITVPNIDWTTYSTTVIHYMSVNDFIQIQADAIGTYNLEVSFVCNKIS